jgi:hypothetical protein
LYASKARQYASTPYSIGIFLEFQPIWTYFFLDEKVGNVVNIVLVKLEPAPAGFCGSEAIQQAKFFGFTTEEEWLRIMRGTEF